MARLGRAFPQGAIIKRIRLVPTAYTRSINATSIVMMGSRSELASRSVAARLASATGNDTSNIVDLSPSYNVTAMFVDGAVLPGNTGLDGGSPTSSAFSKTLFGSGLNFGSFQFSFGPGNVPDSVSNATITLPFGQFKSIGILAVAAGSSGVDQLSQSIVVNYSDATNDTFTQSFSDWSLAGGYPNEQVAFLSHYRNLNTGLVDPRDFNLYFYSFSLNQGKFTSTLQPPANSNVIFLAVSLTSTSPTAGAFAGAITRKPGKNVAATTVPITGSLGGKTTVHTQSAVLNPPAGTVRRAFAHLATAVTVAFSATLSAVKNAATFTFTVAASLLAMAASTLKSTAHASPGATATPSGSTAKSMSHTVAANPPAFSGTIGKLFARALTAATVAMNATVSRRRNTNQPAALIAPAGSKSQATSHTSTSSTGSFSGTRGSATSRIFSATANAFSATFSATKNAVTYTFTVAASLIAMAAATLRSESRSSAASTAADSGSTVRSFSNSRTASTKQPSASISKLTQRFSAAASAVFNGVLSAVQSGAHVLVFAATMLANAGSTARAAARTATATQAPVSGSVTKRITRALVATAAAFNAFITSVRLTFTIPRIRLTGQSDAGAELKGSSTVNSTLTGEASGDDDLTGQQ